MPYGRSPLFAIMASTLRELKIPSFVFGKNEDFEETYKLLQAYVNNSAIIQFVDSRVTNFVKTYRNESVVIANKYHLFLGVYGGPIYINKEEVAETALFSPEKLEKERSAHPEIFTKDLQFFLDEYDKKINYFLKKIPNY